jgi:hypothetical protein
MRLLALLFLLFSLSLAREIPFTLEDRERLIRLEEGQKALMQRIEETNRRINDLYTLMLWGFGILFSGMGILIGFVLWDRRTALEPAVKKARDLEEREERLERVLKKLARKNPDIAEALKEEGLL